MRPALAVYAAIALLLYGCNNGCNNPRRVGSDTPDGEECQPPETSDGKALTSNGAKQPQKTDPGNPTTAGAAKNSDGNKSAQEEVDGGAESVAGHGQDESLPRLRPISPHEGPLDHGNLKTCELSKDGKVVQLLRCEGTEFSGQFVFDGKEDGSQWRPLSAAFQHDACSSDTLTSICIMLKMIFNNLGVAKALCRENDSVTILWCQDQNVLFRNAYDHSSSIGVASIRGCSTTLMKNECANRGGKTAWHS